MNSFADIDVRLKESVDRLNVQGVRAALANGAYPGYQEAIYSLIFKNAWLDRAVPVLYADNMESMAEIAGMLIDACGKKDFIVQDDIKRAISLAQEYEFDELAAFMEARLLSKFGMTAPTKRIARTV